MADKKQIRGYFEVSRLMYQIIDLNEGESVVEIRKALKEGRAFTSLVGNDVILLDDEGNSRSVGVVTYQEPDANMEIIYTGRMA